MKITIEKAGIEHAALLVSLGTTTFVETYADQNTPENMALYLSQSFTPEIIAAELSDPIHHYYVAFAGNEAVGYIKLSHKTIPELVDFSALELNRIYALKSWQGQKIGATLLEKAIEVAQSLPADYLWLGVWTKNERAIAFYQKWGFEIFGEQVFQLGDDPQTDYLMRKKVKAF